MKKLLLTISIGLSIFSQSQNLLTNLQGCYPFDCDPVSNTITPNSVMANNPSLNGTVHNLTCTTGHNNVPNSAFDFPFSASSYIELPSSPLLKPQAISVSGWYNTMNSTTGQYLVWTDNGAQSNFEAYALYINAGSFTVVKHTNSSGGSSATASGVTANVWYHVVFTIDNSFIKIYVNGVLANSNPATNPFNYTTNGKVYLGGTASAGANNSHNAPFHGSMDNIRFYDRVISAGEVDTLFRFDPLCSAGSVTTVPTPTSTNECCLGNYCGSSQNPLFGNYSIPLNNHDFLFLNDADFKNKVNVGYNCGQSTLGKLNVKANFLTNTNSFGGSECIGFSALADNNANNVWLNGIRAEAKTNDQNSIPIGLYSTASGPSDVFGIMAHLSGSAPTTGIQVAGRFSVNKDNGYRNLGVEGFAMGLNTHTSGPNRFNIGVSGYASDVLVGPVYQNQSFYPQSNIGVYGGSGNYTFYSTPSNYYAGWFDGDVMINGVGYNTAFAVFTSDRKFKDDIKKIENATDIISKLNPTTYFMKTENDYGMHFSERKQFGFISQEVETILPELVTDVHKPASVDEDGKEITKAVDFKGLNYMGFIAILTKGLQEQQKQIEELKSLVQSLAGVSGKSSTTGLSANVILTDKKSIVLNQNVPNPFAENTVITYNIPNDFAKAEILFTTNDGVIIKTVQITEKGEGSVNVFANDLSHGVYTYTLVIDGKSIDSKKMIKE